MHRMRRLGSMAAALPVAAALIAAAVPFAAAPAGATARVPRQRIVSTNPAAGTQLVGGATPISITFSHSLARSGAVPTIEPPLAGHWVRQGRTLTFLPDGAYAPLSTVTVVIPGGSQGVRGADGAMIKAKATTFSFGVGGGTVLRAEQLLARLGYLPLQFVPAGGWTTAAAAYSAAVFSPPAGRFVWRFTAPKALQRLWQPGVASTMFRGALMAFQSRAHLPTSGYLSTAVWSALLGAGRHLSANYLRSGYVYAIASKALPESLNIYENGRLVLHSLANTGIPLAPTADGTYPVYLRFANQVMSGVDPWGNHYSDPVSWVAYFNGSDAVHYFDRASYGFQQSLGCVELPSAPAKTAWSFLQIGSLVSVEG